jgi:hypothetical protein
VSDVESWLDKASTLRELAKYTIDADAKRLLLVLAEDCEEKSAHARRNVRARDGTPALAAI